VQPFGTAEIQQGCTCLLSASVNANCSVPNRCKFNLCWLVLLLLEGNLFFCTIHHIETLLIWSLGLPGMSSLTESALPAGIRPCLCTSFLLLLIPLLAGKKTQLTANSETAAWSYSVFLSTWLCLPKM